MAESTNDNNRLLEELARLVHDIKRYVNDSPIKLEDEDATAKRLAERGYTPRQILNVVDDLLQEAQSIGENAFSKEEMEESQRLVDRTEELKKTLQQMGEAGQESLKMTTGA